MCPERVELQELAECEHAAALAEYLTALTTIAEELGDDATPAAENLARAQEAKLRLENAQALLQFIQGARPKH